MKRIVLLVLLMFGISSGYTINSGIHFFEEPGLIKDTSLNYCRLYSIMAYEVDSFFADTNAYIKFYMDTIPYIRSNPTLFNNTDHISKEILIDSIRSEALCSLVTIDSTYPYDTVYFERTNLKPNSYYWVRMFLRTKHYHLDTLKYDSLISVSNMTLITSNISLRSSISYNKVLGIFYAKVDTINTIWKVAEKVKYWLYYEVNDWHSLVLYDSVYASLTMPDTINFIPLADTFKHFTEQTIIGFAFKCQLIDLISEDTFIVYSDTSVCRAMDGYYSDFWLGNGWITPDIYHYKYAFDKSNEDTVSPWVYLSDYKYLKAYAVIYGFDNKHVGDSVYVIAQSQYPDYIFNVDTIITADIDTARKTEQWYIYLNGNTAIDTLTVKYKDLGNYFRWGINITDTTGYPQLGTRYVDTYLKCVR